MEIGSLTIFASIRVSVNAVPTLAYGADLAYIHDVGYSGFANEVAPEVGNILCDHGIVRSTVVELGCGPGTVARYLARRSYRMIGFDQSRHNLRIARSRARSESYHCASFFECPLPRCSAVIAVGECLNYDFDDGSNLEQHWVKLLALFEKVGTALDVGGIFLFDFLGPGQVSPGVERLHHRVGEDWACMARSTEGVATQTLARQITAFRRIGTRYRRSDEIHIQRLHKLDKVCRALESRGFEVVFSRSLGHVQLPPPSRWFVCRKAHSD